MDEKYREGFLAGIEKTVECFTTHDEGFGDYCDTGSDMDWTCRSDCVDHGVNRARKLYAKRKDMRLDADLG